MNEPPTRDPPPPPPPPAASAQPVGCVMVVDDTDSARDVLERLLKRAGFRTATARDGGDALARLPEARPDVLILDIDMPVMDGFGVLQAIRTDPHWRHLPVIMLTALSNQGCINRAAELGVSRYFVKANFSFKELLAEVSRFVRTRDGGCEGGGSNP